MFRLGKQAARIWIGNHPKGTRAQALTARRRAVGLLKLPLAQQRSEFNRGWQQEVIAADVGLGVKSKKKKKKTSKKKKKKKTAKKRATKKRATKKRATKKKTSSKKKHVSKKRVTKKKKTKRRSSKEDSRFTCNNVRCYLRRNHKGRCKLFSKKTKKKKTSKLNWKYAVRVGYRGTSFTTFQTLAEARSEAWERSERSTKKVYILNKLGDEVNVYHHGQLLSR